MQQLIIETEKVLNMLMVLHDCYLGDAGPIVRADVKARIEAAQVALGAAWQANKPHRGEQRIVLPLPPLGNRYLRRAGHTIYKTKEAKEYCEYVSFVGAQRKAKVLSGDVKIAVDVYRARRAGDLDGYQKVLLDSLEGVLYENDRQIVDNHSRRFDDPKNPRVEVTVSEVR